MGSIKGLSIVESPYCNDLLWVVDSDDPRKILASGELYDVYGDIEDYRRCGVYHKAGVPVEITKAEYDPSDELPVYSAISRSISDACCKGLKKGNVLLLPGGHCTFFVGVAGGIQRALGRDRKVGIVWLDAHGDMNTPANTSTGLLSGMALGVIMGLGIPEWSRAAGIEKPIKGSGILVSDCRDASEGALSNAAAEGVKLLGTKSFQDTVLWENEVNRLAERVDVLWLHVDVDILDEKYIPAFGYPLSPGTDLETVSRNITSVLSTGKTVAMSFSNVWMNYEETSGLEVRTLNAMRLMGSGLESWKECPDLLK